MIWIILAVVAWVIIMSVLTSKVIDGLPQSIADFERKLNEARKGETK